MPKATQPADEEGKYVSVKWAADYLGGVTTWTVYRLCDEKQIESRYLGKRRLVLLESLKEYAAGLPETREVS